MQPFRPWRRGSGRPQPQTACRPAPGAISARRVPTRPSSTRSAASLNGTSAPARGAGAIQPKCARWSVPTTTPSATNGALTGSRNCDLSGDRLDQDKPSGPHAPAQYLHESLRTKKSSCYSFSRIISPLCMLRDAQIYQRTACGPLLSCQMQDCMQQKYACSWIHVKIGVCKHGNSILASYVHNR